MKVICSISKIVSSYCDFKRCSFNAQHILILPAIKHSFDGKLMMDGFGSEFLFRINVLVKKKKKLMQTDVVSYELEAGRQPCLPCHSHGESFALWKSRQLGATSVNAGLPYVIYLLLKYLSVNVKVKKKTREETQEGFFVLECLHGSACLLLVPLFSRIPFCLFVPQKA